MLWNIAGRKDEGLLSDVSLFFWNDKNERDAKQWLEFIITLGVGVFTQTVEDPRRRNNVSLGLHADILVHEVKVPSRKGIYKIAGN